MSSPDVPTKLIEGERPPRTSRRRGDPLLRASRIGISGLLNGFVNRFHVRLLDRREKFAVRPILVNLDAEFGSFRKKLVGALLPHGVLQASLLSNSTSEPPVYSRTPAERLGEPMSVLISRATWGARHGRGNRAPEPRDSVTFHHFYRPNIGVVSTAREREVMRSVEAYHARNLTPSNPRIGYQVVIFQSGRAYEGTGRGRIGAHAAGQNTRREGIAFAIDGDSVTLTPEAIECARRVIQEGRENGHLRRDVFATRHADFSSKSCPGGNVPRSVCDSLLLPPGSRIDMADRVLSFTDPMMRGNDVRAWQENLATWREAIGGGPDPVVPDGIFGRLTRNESSRFMRDVMGIDTADPRVGPNTLKAWDAWNEGRSMSETPQSFTDTAGSTHERSIDVVTEAGLMQGYSDGTFRPGDPLTRGQFASVIAKLLEKG